MTGRGARSLLGVAGCLSGALVGAGSLAAGCTENSAPAGAEAGLYTDAGHLGPRCTPGGAIDDFGSLALKTFCPPSDPGANSIYVTASGEALALHGFAFPPLDPATDTWMVDGWTFTLDEFIAVIGDITVWQDPDLVPSDQSRHGPEVAYVAGPFAVDLHKGGDIVGQGGGGEEATPIATITQMGNGQPFDPTVTYAFGFSTLPATYDAYNVNLTRDERDDYRAMVSNRYSVLYVGHAVWNGGSANDGVGGSCTETPVVPPYDFAGPGTGSSASEGGAAEGGTGRLPFPQSMRFTLGFSTPTNYVNCQNGTEFLGTPGVDGEEHPRGIQVQPNASVPAQVTIHADHPFWESFVENSPLHWDQIAAQFVGVRGSIDVVTEDFMGVDFTAFTDGQGYPLPWRNCSGSYYQPGSGGQMHFDPLDVPVDIRSGDPGAALRDYYDYIRYTQSTQGHLNSQGLCFIDRQYPAPQSGRVRR